MSRQSYTKEHLRRPMLEAVKMPRRGRSLFKLSKAQHRAACPPSLPSDTAATPRRKARDPMTTLILPQKPTPCAF